MGVYRFSRLECKNLKRSTRESKRRRARGPGATKRTAPRRIRTAKNATGSAAGTGIEMVREVAETGIGIGIGRRRERKGGNGGKRIKRGRRGRRRKRRRRRGKEKEGRGNGNGKRERGLGGVGVVPREKEKENGISTPEIAGNECT